MFLIETSGRIVCSEFPMVTIFYFDPEHPKQYVESRLCDREIEIIGINGTIVHAFDVMSPTCSQSATSFFRS